MKHILSESSSGGSVTAATKAYRHVFAQHGLVGFSRQEIEGALATLHLEGCGHIGSRDIRFQAAITRLRSREGLSSQTVEGIIHQLVNSEYDLDQAEWERDCHRRVSLSHSTFRLPR
ncbi:MAG TPA: hypothetical protein VNA25_15510 [Phycisphaerae bacterium]|nr:hypothetical protein [Phycisphaerae bacterium]